MREVTMVNRMMVAGIAESLIDANEETKAQALLNAVRCCDEFPECSHVLAEIERMDDAAAGLCSEEEA
jgi:hypothetical protein